MLGLEAPGHALHGRSSPCKWRILPPCKRRSARHGPSQFVGLGGKIGGRSVFEGLPRLAGTSLRAHVNCAMLPAPNCLEEQSDTIRCRLGKDGEARTHTSATRCGGPRCQDSEWPLAERAPPPPCRTRLLRRAPVALAAARARLPQAPTASTSERQPARMIRVSRKLASASSLRNSSSLRLRPVTSTSSMRSAAVAESTQSATPSRAGPSPLESCAGSGGPSRRSNHG